MVDRAAPGRGGLPCPGPTTSAPASSSPGAGREASRCRSVAGGGRGDACAAPHTVAPAANVNPCRRTAAETAATEFGERAITVRVKGVEERLAAERELEPGRVAVEGQRPPSAGPAAPSRGDQPGGVGRGQRRARGATGTRGRAPRSCRTRRPQSPGCVCVWQTGVGARAVAQRERPPERARGQGGPRAGAGRAAEGDRVSHRPRRRGVGAPIVTVGGAPIVIACAVVAWRPPGSVTRRRTVIVPALGVGARGPGGGRVVVGAVTVEVPGVGQRPALRVARRRGRRMRRSAARAVASARRRCAPRRVVVGGDPADRPARQIGVVQRAVGALGEPHRPAASPGEGLARAHVRQPVRRPCRRPRCSCASSR